MDEKYFAQKIEQKWQKRWAESGAFEAEVDAARPKFYCLEMLPYPSGRLHMGHVRNYSIGDALAWYKRLQGFNVLHPIGWDSFGQPAEQAAIKKGVNPREWTEDNINQMREQLQRLGVSYDWRREIAAHRPEYYKFDQWFFLKMYEMGLAYKKMTKVNWCPRDQTTLSNEQASGGVCWRCGSPVEKKDLAQWFLRITAYAEELLGGMTEIEAGWAERVLTMQKNWIGRSEGAFVEFEVRAANGIERVSGETHSTENSNAETSTAADGSDKAAADKIRIFTTRIDTIYGANAILVSAYHPIIESNFDNFSDEVKAKIEEIKIELAKPTDYGEEVEKDGVDTGLKATNPFSGEELPVWVGNYVMIEYGTGAVMSVPAHDERDFEFAKKFNLSIKQVISAKDAAFKEKDETSIALDKTSNVFDKASNVLDETSKTLDKTSNIFDKSSNVFDKTSKGLETTNNPSEAFTEYGILMNSGEWTGKTSEDAKREMAEYAAKNNFGKATVNFRLRDWGISRQRFWGAPIPIIYCEHCGTVPVAIADLPVRLPESAPFTGVGESPLAKVPEFVNTFCPKCGAPARRETDTMDTFVDSSWYYFRYADPHNEDMPFNPEVVAYWLPVEQYIGGVDHAVMHLLYTRFWTRAMRDMGLVNFDEPVRNLLTQGMVVGESYYSEEKASYIPPDEVNIERDERGKILSAALASDDSPVKVAVEKMSKSKYNGVDPDDMVLIYGADAVRIFALFAAPAENELVWQETGIDGAVRFLQRVYRFVYRWREAISGVWPNVVTLLEESDTSTIETTGQARKLRQKTHQSIKRITDNFESYQFNTPVAALMELSNALGDFKIEPEAASGEELFAVTEAVRNLILMLAPYAPHIAEELWEVLSGSDKGILASGARFPTVVENLAKADEIEIPIQVNGKLRSRILVAPETAQKELEALALSDAKIKEHTDGKQIVKVIVVPNRLVNVVVKG
ncbi:MAG TPA: class I tRNA ligase family protein [Pyrinomonadaceae bacterium]|jgi:leucyl-tRNA synthetase